LATGTVKFFNSQKGFGRFTPEDGGKDVFVHRSNIQTPDQTIGDGQKVTYEVGAGRKGPEALNVRPV